MSVSDSGSTMPLERWLAVGDLVPDSGVRRLLRAFAAWTATRPDGSQTRLTIVGRGRLRDELRATAADLRVEDSVDIVDPGEDPLGAARERFADHDVFVHLPVLEGYSPVLVEAATAGLPVVVTRCGGAESPLAVANVLGLAQFVPVGEGRAREEVAPVVEAMALLAVTADPENVPLSQRHLRRIHGPEAIVSPTAPPTPGLRVLALATTRAQARVAEEALVTAATYGGGGVYLTAIPPQRPLPESVQVIDIADVEKRAPLSRAERLAVLRAPATALRALGKAARLAGRVSPGLGRAAVEAVGQLQTLHRSAAHEFRHRGGYAHLWEHVGPWYTAHRLEADGRLDAVDLDAVDCLVMGDRYTSPFAVRVLRRRPDLEVTNRWSRHAVISRYVDVALRE